MDITNIPQNLIKTLEQKSTDQLAALSRVLNLVLGKTVMASVVSTEPVTPQERAELLKQTTAALAQLNQQTVGKLTPAIKNEIARLMQQQNLIQSPELKWINLKVNGRSLLTYSDRPLTAGQSVPVQMQSPQKLVLLDLPAGDEDQSTTDSTALTPKTPPAVASALTAQQLVKLATNLPLGDSVPKTPTNPTIQTAAEDLTPAVSEKNLKAVIEKNQASTPLLDSTNKAVQQKINLYNTAEAQLKPPTTTTLKQPLNDNSIVKQIVSEQLRNLLPHRDTPNTLLSAVVQLNNLPPAAKSQLFTPSLEQALKSVAEKIRSPEQIAQPKVLAQTLKNSGVFFENTLGKHLAVASSPQEHSRAISNSYSQDLKGALLTLVNKASQELNGNNKPLSSEQAVKLFQNLASLPVFNQTNLASTTKQDITQVLGLFVQELMQKPVKELSNKELRAQLLVLLQQHGLHSLAKIQLQQLHSLNHELDTRDSNTPSASWQIEIPVKHHNDVHQVHLRIDREWVDEKNESQPEKSNSKIKQWSVTLRFDLPTLGEFCAQLSIVNTQVSATLWATQEKTFKEVKDHVDGLRKQLENEGIQVKFLQCMRGMPPKKPMALSYSLIDIST
ncbi:flagellar hook-length control protein FliK [Cellvibrio sp.]|uniref:flagellar hook-length control protein FliK n=1 Tax=Cellvibrio sp. TaxID=1965322 RepID=UPI00396475D2